MNVVPLFPYPVCCICWVKLHDGHHGWDVCANEDPRELATLDDRSCECYANPTIQEKAPEYEEPRP